jgi:PLP dependent protein
VENRKETFEKKLALITSKLPPEAHLLIVSKNQSEADIKHYYELGHRDFGENRVQELIEKSQNLKAACPEIRWHMIGKLQTNKVNLLYTVPNLHAIHSVDNFSLIEKLVRSETRLDHDVLIFLQFNTSREVEKSGF